MEFVKCFTPVTIEKKRMFYSSILNKLSDSSQIFTQIQRNSTFLGKSRLNFIEKVIVGVNS